ncbi:MAG: glycosyltransferase family 2 protein [Bacteroidota bacterium]
MKVCGFTFVRNGVKFDYPFEEAIRSMLPICDEIIVAVGNSDDDTLVRVKAIDPKVTVIETIWDETLREGGKVLASETDKAFQAIPSHYDWAFYIQGDEVVHEKYLPTIKKGMLDYLGNPNVEGLLFNYTHFFGSYEYVGLKYSWYRREIRIIRNNKNNFSYKDAQGFRKKPNEKLKVKLIDAHIFHYGWAREPEALQGKEKSKAMFYHGDNWISRNFSRSNKYEYDSMLEPIRKYTETHPEVMKERIGRQNWKFNPDLSLKYSSLKDKFKRVMGDWTGWYPGEYKNYKRL